MKNKHADGLRGVAAFTVAITHFLAAFLPSALHNNYPTIFAANKTPGVAFQIATSPLATIFYNGNLAVLVFFVLSGYVLTLPYFDNPDSGKRYLQLRLWGRYLRLNIPIACAVLLSFAVYKLGLYWNVQASEISGSSIWLHSFLPKDISALTAMREGLYDSIVFGRATLVPPLWTLKIEFVGSVLLLAFYILKPPGRALMLILPLFVILYLFYGQESIFYYAIFFGSFLHQLDRLPRLALFTAGLYFGCFQFNSLGYDFLPVLRFDGHDVWEKQAFYNTIGATLITAAVVKGFAARFFEHRVIQFLGRMSFSLYLLHFVILCSLSCFIYINSPHSAVALAGNFAIYIAVCLFASKIFERCVDRPAIDIAHRVGSRFFEKRSSASALR